MFSFRVGRALSLYDSIPGCFPFLACSYITVIFTEYVEYEVSGRYYPQQILRVQPLIPPPSPPILSYLVNNCHITQSRFPRMFFFLFRRGGYVPAFTAASPRYKFVYLQCVVLRVIERVTIRPSRQNSLCVGLVPLCCPLRRARHVFFSCSISSTP